MRRKFKNPQMADKSHINTLRFAIFLLSVVAIGLVITLVVKMQEPEQVRLSLPPDIRYGASITTGEINPWEIYQFAGMVNQLINSWHQNGALDYEENLGKYSALYTRKYLAQKVKDLNAKKQAGELDNRIRSVTPLGAWSDQNHCGVYQQDCVKALGGNRWQVWIDINLKEHQITRGVNALPYLVKDESIRIPIVVIYENDQPIYNPWGLKLDLEVSDKIVSLGVSQ